ncbi:DUF3060 domain-containing protein [Mycobacterium sp.]|uniref:DUF3060 domain-containing protein n=1 Tax=Mycobacterium sp. TaxID=1785 RepID=UPI0031D91C90
MRVQISGGSGTSVLGALVLATVLVAGLAGCGSKNDNATPSTATSATPSSGAELQVGNTINYGSFGTTTDLDCGDGKSLNVGGSSNTLTVKGTCASVSIGGADNKISFDKIDQHLSVVGLNNTITYKHGAPKVDNLGSGNTITKG